MILLTMDMILQFCRKYLLINKKNSGIRDRCEKHVLSIFPLIMLLQIINQLVKIHFTPISLLQRNVDT